MDRSFQTETALRSRLQKVLDLIYKLGYYCGFETGERVVRYVYFSSHSNENTYSFLPLDRGNFDRESSNKQDNVVLDSEHFLGPLLVNTNNNA